MRIKWIAPLVSLIVLAGCGGDGPTTPGDVSPQPADSGVRSFSAPTYTPGQPVTVAISVVPDNTSVAYAMEDQIPTGWTVSNINESGVFDPVTNKVKWGIFFNQCPEFFTYTLTPPAQVAGDQPFTGTLSVDGTDHPLSGQATLSHS